MTQNIYDTPAFFEGYSQLERSHHGLSGAPEWPALRALLPDLQGARVIDLGCGYGWFCRWAAEQGASSVLGLDVSQKMLARAQSSNDAASIRYVRADLEHLELPGASAELVYSSLTLHYIEHLAHLFRQAYQALVPGGWLVFSIEHPIFMAPVEPGWLIAADGRKVWPLDSYQVEGPRVTDWLAKGVIKQHRTVGTLLNLLIGAGFMLKHVEEWGPTDAMIAAQPALAEERERPMLLLVAAQRPR